MITIDLGNIEFYDSTKNEFVYEHGGIVRFEYSLRALYEWEGKWKKPFLKNDKELTGEELIDFYMKMALDPIDIRFMTIDVMKKLSEYINDPQTATVFTDKSDGSSRNKKSNKTFTSEELYAMMTASNVPLDFENRNLNRLMVVLRIISNYNNPPKKMSRNDILKENARLNAERKAKLNSKG